MDQSTNTFVYRSLDPSNDEIRLIRLLPATEFSAVIHCELFHDCLENNPGYEALSYAWGDATVTAPIFLDQYEFLITVNLAAALRHLRLLDNVRTLWVDAICIDQQNLVERGEQVAQMGRIYQSSLGDVFWLGVDTGLDEDAAALLKRPFHFETIQSWPDSPFMEEVRELEQIFSDTTDGHRLTNQLCKVFTEPAVWSRIWIVQELALARDVQVVYGSHTFLWTSLLVVGMAQTILCFRRMLAEPESEEVSLMAPPVRQVLTIRHTASKSESLISLWREFGNFGASDPRDRIYALLALAKDNFHIKPDYNRATEDLYYEVTRRIIYETGSLEILILGILETDEEITDSTSSLPSWMPMFDVEFQGEPGNITWESFSPGIADPPRFDLASIEHYTDPKVLTVRGIFLDSLERIPNPNIVLGWTLQDHFDLCCDLKIGLSQNSTYSNGDDVFDAYSGTFLFENKAGRGLAQYMGLTGDSSRYQKLRTIFLNYQNTTEIDDHELHELAEEFTRHAGLNAVGTRFGLSRSGYFAMLPPGAEVTDMFCVLYGCQAVMVLRRVSGDADEERYRVVGPAYVHGFMAGEAISMLDQGLLVEQEFNIV